jgi:hypothetical protein
MIDGPSKEKIARDRGSEDAAPCRLHCSDTQRSLPAYRHSWTLVLLWIQRHASVQLPILPWPLEAPRWCVSARTCLRCPTTQQIRGKSTHPTFMCSTSNHRRSSRAEFGSSHEQRLHIVHWRKITKWRGDQPNSVDRRWSQRKKNWVRRAANTINMYRMLVADQICVQILLFTSPYCQHGGLADGSDCVEYTPELVVMVFLTPFNRK